MYRMTPLWGFLIVLVGFILFLEVYFRRTLRP
jgi:hypothetical protein